MRLCFYDRPIASVSFTLLLRGSASTIAILLPYVSPCLFETSHESVVRPLDFAEFGISAHVVRCIDSVPAVLDALSPRDGVPLGYISLCVSHVLSLRVVCLVFSPCPTGTYSNYSVTMASSCVSCAVGRFANSSTLLLAYCIPSSIPLQANMCLCICMHVCVLVLCNRCSVKL